MSPELKNPDPPPTAWLEERTSPPKRPTAAATAPRQLEGRVGPTLVPPGADSRPGRSTKLAQLGLGLLAGVCVGVSLLLAEPFQHRCAATLQVIGGADLAGLDAHRRDLLNFIWSGAGQAARGISPAKWQVELPPANGTIQLSLLTSDARIGAEQVKAVAEEYSDHQQAATIALLANPSESESYVQKSVDTLSNRLDEAQRQLETATARLPVSDPRADRTALLERWSSARRDFDGARLELIQAADEFERLTLKGEPTRAVVPSEVRDAALLGDADLQQDLKELTATLTEMKLHLLGVWQGSASPLEQVIRTASEQLQDLAKTDSGADNSSTVSGTLSGEMSRYHDGAVAFAKNWNAEFTALRDGLIDPQTSFVLDVHQRVRTLLGDFLFRSGTQLANMREQVTALSRNSSDDVRNHLQQSQAARALAELQTAHHRFEFSAGALDSPDNFRLDSALRIARGLRRRVTDRVRAIDEQLQRDAVAQARQERATAIAQLDSMLRKSRQASDQTVQELIALQDQLHSASASTEQFVAAVAAAELANHRLQTTRVDLDTAQKQLRELAQKRQEAIRDARLEVVSAGVLQSYVNLGDRVRAAAIGGSVTFLAVLLGQLLLARRLWPASGPRVTG